MVERHKNKFYDSNKFSDVFLPVRMAGKWLLIVPEPKARKTACVIFEESDYN